MDVELLRPGTVPMSPDRVLWFEFLLHQDLLKSHLQKPVPDPTGTDLITKFYDAISDSLRNRIEENGESVETVMSNQPAKNIALKILSLKVAAFIKWDLSELRSLPFKTQIHLFQDALYFTNNKTLTEVPFVKLKQQISTYSLHYLFIIVMYHRWILHITMHRVTSSGQLRHVEITPIEEILICAPDQVDTTIGVLIDALAWKEIPPMLTFDCFKLPTENNDLEFDWSLAEKISREEFTAQINYDIGTYYFYKENYKEASEHFQQALINYKDLKKSHSIPTGFINIHFDTLMVYVNACKGDISKGGLLEQLNASLVNQYTGITTILMQDNGAKEIPLSHRLTLELNIQGALSSGTFTVARDLLYKIRALNFVRCILEQKPAISTLKNLKNGDMLIWAVSCSWKELAESDKELIKKYLIELVLKNELPDLLNSIKKNDLISIQFDKSDYEFIEKTNSVQIPQNLLQPNWNIYDCTRRRKPNLEVKQLEQELIATYDHKTIRDLLLKISVNPLATSVWSINPQWELPIPIQSVLKSLQRGFLQDFGFVMLAKAREQMLNKIWNSSLKLMLILDKELNTNGNVAKLKRLISWEILLVQVTQLQDEWPKSATDKTAIANACEACLQTNDSILPRTEIIEQCIICLLNLGRWEFLASVDKRWISFEIAAALSLACQDLVKHKGGKKFTKNIWDFVLPIFSVPPQQSKRQGNQPFHDAQITNLRNNLMAIFLKIRDSTALTVIITLLTRLHNILKDESSVELQAEYVFLWPPVLSNANSYSLKQTSEVLSQILIQALIYYPTNITWLRLMGDLNFVNGHYNISMKFYLKSLLIYNDYFNNPLRHDDHVFRRMIKSCIALGCNTQAAVLCQFLEEPDYVLAFRMLSEQKTSFDAVDAYYHCIWDTTILEFLIHNHNKKGEYQKRKCATQVMGLLELNSNNNEEIQREAGNLRKSMFLRALCKQYVF